jgi:hypothetical protein
LETTELPPNLLQQDEKLIVLEANVKKPQTRAALNKIPKNLCLEINQRRVEIKVQQLFTAMKNSNRNNLKRMRSREFGSISNTLRVLPKVDLKLVQVFFLGCHAKATHTIPEEMLLNVTVTSNSKAYKYNSNIFHLKGKKGHLSMERYPIFLPKNKETQITLTISLVGTGYFLDHRDCPVIENTPYFKKISLANDNFVLFFESFGFVPV